MTLPGPDIRAEDVPGLCAALAERYRCGTPEVRCDLAALTAPGPGTLEALARLALTARRCGGRLRLTGTPLKLAALLELTGLGQALRQAEEREPPGRVQEGVEAGDAAP
ncbi:STAS domain-containing protein [Streptomyces sp. NPDC089919]|uniref:STAS domain-containing protein n=1 Tax=Streptomyces sp. NPDC089919 TaxID=3155188 RepID=UPI00341C2080